MKSIAELQEAYAYAAGKLASLREMHDAAGKEESRLRGLVGKATEARNVTRSDLLNAIEKAAGSVLSPPAAERTANGDLAFVVGRKYRLKDTTANDSDVVYRVASVGAGPKGFDALLEPDAKAKWVPLSQRGYYDEAS